ncbi:MAG: 50S ribosomal protein L24 [Planctomycetota bacterium]|nr:50S ribosomal protein L24 [Planctomycetota bacterium]
MKLRKGDTVIVISGNDRGQTGTVQEVMREKNRVVVEGINLRYRHRKPTQQNPQGERVRLESSINASNVMLYDEKAKKGVRKRIAKEG